MTEFVYGGEYRAMPNPDTCSDTQWSAYVFHRNNAPTVKKEWWFHQPSSTWLIAERNTANDEVLTTYLPNALKQEVGRE